MSTRTESINAKNSPGDKTRQNTLGGSSSNEEMIRRLYAVAEKQDPKAFVALFADDGYFWDVSAGQKYYGDDIGKTVEVYAAAFPDMHRELYSMWSVGDMVFVELSLNGTNQGDLALPLGTVPATHQKMSTPCFDAFRLRDGKVTQFHCYTAATQLLGQLGVLANLGAALKKA